MHETAPTWSTARELIGVILAPQHLKRTLCITLIVGTVFFTRNQLGGHPRRPRDGCGLDQGRADVSDSPARLQFRAALSHATANCQAPVTVEAMKWKA